jgi:outer membrane receptor protein involved in Fe transport
MKNAPSLPFRNLCSVARRIALGCLILLLEAAMAFAQTAGTGALAGTITDSSGAVVPDAQVRITNTSTGEERTVISGLAGTYMAGLLPPGSYRVEVAKQGFKTATRADLQVAVTETASLNIQLTVGQATESVTIAAEAAIVQTESSALGRVVNTNDVTSLPLVTRNFTQILGLSPGAQTNPTNASELGRGTGGADGSSAGAKIVNGARAFDNNFEMNGIQVNDHFGTGARFANTDTTGGVPVPNPDTIQEFKVQTGQFDASYGRNAGANVTIVTKSGTNEFHGSLFEFLRNEDLNANTFFRNLTGAARPILRQNQYGFTAGGPIRKDRFFAFGSYQRTDQTNGLAPQCSAQVFSPPITDSRSAAALGALFGANGVKNSAGVPVAADGSNIDAAALKLLQLKLANGQYLFPSPQTLNAGAPFLTQGFSTFSAPCTYGENQFMTNVDFLQTTKSKFGGRYFQATSGQKASIPTVGSFGINNVPGINWTTDYGYHIASLSHSYVFTPRLLNQLNLGFNDISVSYGNAHLFNWSDLGVGVPLQGDAFPSVVIAGSYAVSTPSPIHYIQRSYNFADNVYYSLGKHTLRFGGGVSRNLADQWGYEQPSTVNFGSFTDFLTGGPLSGSLSITNLFDRKYRTWDGNAYVQDDYKVTPRLTLNLGLRYERLGTVNDVLGRNTDFNLGLVNTNPPATGTLAGYVVSKNFPGTVPSGVTQTDHKYAINGEHQNAWAPRFGFAWQILPKSSRFVLRGGFSINNSEPTALPEFFTSLSPPWALVQQNTPGLLAGHNFEQPFLQPYGLPSQLPSFIPYSSGAPYTNRLVFDDVHFRPAYSEQFSLNLQTDLGHNYLLEVGYVGAHGVHLTDSFYADQALLASASNPVHGVTTTTVGNILQRLPYPGFVPAVLIEINSQGQSWYNALQASLTKRLSKGLQFLLAYTYSKTLDSDGANIVSAAESTPNPGNQSLPHARYGPTNFDHRQRFVLSYTYDLPGLANGSRLARGLLNGWGLSGVTTIQTGASLTITDTNRNNAFGISGTNGDRAQLSGACTYSQIVNPGSVSSKVNSYFNAGCFTHQYPVIGSDGIATGFGNSGVGIVTGPGLVNFDTSLSKKTAVSWPNERANMEFRAEFFNLFNTPAFDNPDTSFFNPTFGRITNLIVSPRIGQLALKFNF